MTQLDAGNFTSLNLEAIRKAGVYCNILAATSGNRSDFKAYSSGTTARAFGDTTPASKRKFFKAVKKLTSLGLLTKKGKNYVALPFNREEEFAQIPNDLNSLPQELYRFYACLKWAHAVGKKVNKYVLNQKVGLQFKKGKSLEALIAEFSLLESIPNRLELLKVLDKEAPTRFDIAKKEKIEKLPKPPPLVLIKNNEEVKAMQAEKERQEAEYWEALSVESERLKWQKQHEEDLYNRRHDGFRVEYQSVVTLEEFAKEQEKWAEEIFEGYYKKREFQPVKIPAEIRKFWDESDDSIQRPTEFYWNKINELATQYPDHIMLSTPPSEILLQSFENSPFSAFC